MDLMTYFQMLGFVCLVGIWHIPAAVKMALVVMIAAAMLRSARRSVFSGRVAMLPARQAIAAHR